MKLLDFIDRLLAGVERIAIVILLSSMVLLAFLQVVLRNVFSTGWLWADPLLRYAVVWAGFTGAALATYEQKHFGIELLGRFLKPRAAHAVRCLTSALAGIVAILLFRASVQFLIDGIGAEETDLFGLSKRLYFGIIPGGFGLVGLHFLLHTIRHGAAFISGRPGSPDPLPQDAIV